MEDYIVVEFSSGRKIAIVDKSVRFVHGVTALLSCLDQMGDRKIRTIVNVEQVTVIRRPEEHEIEWCKSFHF